MTMPAAGEEPIPGYLSIRHLSHRYGNADAPALDDISLDVPQGATFGLLGPNGAGKSTLLAILTGIQALQSGNVHIGGHSLTSELQAIKVLGALVPQDFAFYPTLTGRENLRFFAGLYRLSNAEWRERFGRCVEVCRLQEVLDRPADRYSGGLKRRLNLAIGLLAAPRILYLDEPTVGIDAVSRGYILDAIAALKGGGTTIVYTSHYMEEVEALCDELAVIDRGKVVAHDRVARLLNRQGSHNLRLDLAQPASQAVQAELARWQPHWTDARRVVLTTPPEDIGALLSAVLSIFARHALTVERLQYGMSRLHDVYLKLLEDRA